MNELPLLKDSSAAVIGSDPAGDPGTDQVRLAAGLLSATAVVIMGTGLIDATRLWLLIIPVSFLLAAFAAGTLIIRLSPQDHPAASALTIRLGAGIACLALMAVFSATLGLLWVAGLTACLSAAVGLRQALRVVGQLRVASSLILPMSTGLLLGLAWLLVWLWATIPPTFFDELAYHLVIPQRALATQSLPAIPWVLFTLMPHASDLLLAWGMAIGGDLGARATHAALWVACSLAALGAADAVTWPRTSPWIIALIVLALASSPTLWFLATLPFAETCLTVGVVSATTLLLLPRSGPWPWLPLGLLLALIALVKLSGLFWVLALLTAARVLGWPWRDLSRATLVLLACMAPWWVRTAVHAGNPIYPLGYRLLGSSFWSDASQARLLGDLPYGSGGMDLLTLLRLPLDLVRHPEWFGSASDVGAIPVLATCLLLTLPLVARIKVVAPRIKRMSDASALFVLVAGAFWVSTTPTTRFFAPVLALSLAALVGLVTSLDKAPQMLGVLLLAAAALWGTWRFIQEHNLVFSSAQVALGMEGRDAYLARRLDHFAAARFVREQLPADARLLFIGETRPYYFARNSIAPSAYDSHPLFGWVRESSSPEALATRLAAEGISHVVLNTREFTRLHDAYHLLTFSGDTGEADAARLKALPTALTLLFQHNRVFVFAVSRAQQGGTAQP